MGAATNLLIEVQRKGVSLEVAGDRLVVDGPAHVLTDALIARLRNHKPSLLCELELRENIEEYVAERTAIQVYDGGADPATTEAQVRRSMRPYQYRLAGSDQWLVVITRGDDLATAKRHLELQFGERFLEVRLYDRNHRHASLVARLDPIGGDV
jgi:hypothetical protein